jgi:hypothetical protein
MDATRNTKSSIPPADRRSGRDRRQVDGGPPSRHERRRNVEPRQPEVVELEFSQSQWDAMHQEVLTR